MKLLNFNVEAQCTPSRSALLTGRHPIRSGTATVPITGGAGRVDPVGSDQRTGALRRGLRDRHVGQVAPRQRPRAPQPDRLRLRRSRVESAHRRRGVLGDAVVLPRREASLRHRTRARRRSRWSSSRSTRRRRAPKTEVVAHLRRGVARGVRSQDHRLGDRLHDSGRTPTTSPSTCTCRTRRCTSRRSPIPSTRARPSAGTGPICWSRWMTSPARSSTRSTSSALADDTIVVWSSDNGADSTYRFPAMDPDPAGGQWNGFSGPWRGGYFTSLEGSNRTPCIVRWPGKVPAGKVSNELVHEVDWFNTLLLTAGARSAGRPSDRRDGHARLPAR